MTYKRNKVLIIRNAYNWQFGGAEKFTFNMASALNLNKLEAVVISNVPELLSKCHKTNIKAYRNLWLKNETRRRFALLYYFLIPLLILQYLFIIITNNISIVVTSGRDEDMFATQAAKILGKPVIWVDHADMKGIISKPFPFFRKLYFNSMGYASKIVAVSNYEKNEIFENLEINREKFIVINNGAIKAKGKKISRPAKSIIMGYVGRLEKDKGINEIIYSFSKLTKKYKNVYGWIAGSGHAENRVKKLASSNYKIKYFGYLDNVYDLLESIDLFVYPSYHDASPLAPVEALLAGVPVVATNVGGIPEVLNDKCSVLIDAKSKEQLISALNSLIINRSRLKRLSRGAGIVGTEYNFEQIIIEKYMPLINSLL